MENVVGSAVGSMAMRNNFRHCVNVALATYIR